MSSETDYALDNNGADSSNVSETQTDSTNTFSDLTNSDSDKDRIAGQAEQTIKYNQSATEKQESATTTNQIKPPVSSKNKPTRKQAVNKSVSKKIDSFQIDSEETASGRLPGGLIDQPENQNPDSGEKYQPDENKNPRLEHLLQIMTKFPEVNRDFLILLKALPDEDFFYYAENGFKANQIILHTAWIYRGAIGHECRRRNEAIKSKGGRGSKGRGFAVELEKVAAAVGISSSYLNDEIRIYEAFIEDAIPLNAAEETRQSKRDELIEGINLQRCFYYRALKAHGKRFEAVELARIKLSETAGEYTEAEYRQDVEKLINPGPDDAHLENETETNPIDVAAEENDEDEKVELTCRLPQKWRDYVQDLARVWKVSIDQGVEFLIENHFRSANPTQEAK